MLLHAVLHNYYIQITQQLHVCNAYVIKFHITQKLHRNYILYYTHITYVLHLCNIYVITYKLHEILHEYYGHLIDFIIKNLNFHVITLNYMNCACNYMLHTYYTKFTRVFHTCYIILTSKLHADCNIHVIQHVMTFPPISESRGERHYMLLQEI